jgi:hypothetical protein
MGARVARRVGAPHAAPGRVVPSRFVQDKPRPPRMTRPGGCPIGGLDATGLRRHQVGDDDGLVVAKPGAAVDGGGGEARRPAPSDGDREPGAHVGARGQPARKEGVFRSGRVRRGRGGAVGCRAVAPSVCNAPSAPMLMSRRDPLSPWPRGTATSTALSIPPIRVPPCGTSARLLTVGGRQVGTPTACGGGPLVTCGLRRRWCSAWTPRRRWRRGRGGGTSVGPRVHRPVRASRARHGCRRR